MPASQPTILVIPTPQPTTLFPSGGGSDRSVEKEWNKNGEDHKVNLSQLKCIKDGFFVVKRITK